MKTRTKVRLAGWAIGGVGVAMLVKSRHDPATCRYCQAPAQLREVEAAATVLRADVASYRAQVGQLYRDELAADERARTVLADRERQRTHWLLELEDWERRMCGLKAQVASLPGHSSSRPVAFQNDQGAPS